MEFEPHSPLAEGLVGAFRKYLNARNRGTTCTRRAPKTAKLMVYSHEEGGEVLFINGCQSRSSHIISNPYPMGSCELVYLGCIHCLRDCQQMAP